MHLISAVPGFGDVFAAGKRMLMPVLKIGMKMFRNGSKAMGGMGRQTAMRWGPATGVGPLGPEVAATFRGASYTQSITTEATTLYRAYGGNAGKVGSYWTRTAPTGPLQAKIDSALNPAWGNTAQNISKISVPKGQTIFEGFAAPQGGLLGGGSQIYIPKINPKWLIP